MPLAPVPRLRRRAPIVLAATGALALAACGGGGDDGTTSTSTSNSGGTATASGPSLAPAALASVVPQSAIGFAQVELRPDGDAKSGVDAAAKALGITDVPKAVDDAFDFADKDEKGRSVRSTLLPLLGDHAGGFVVPQGSGARATGAGAIVAEVKDAAGLRRVAADELKGARQVKVGSQTVYLRPASAGDDGPGAVWIGDKTAAIGDEPAVRAAAQGGANLASSARYKGAIAEVKTSAPLAQAYGDLKGGQALVKFFDGGSDSLLSGRSSSERRALERRLGGGLGSLDGTFTNMDATVAVAASATPGQVTVASGGTQPKNYPTTFLASDTVGNLPSGSWAGLGLDVGSLAAAIKATEGAAGGSSARVPSLSALLDQSGVKIPAELQKDLESVSRVTVGLRGTSILGLGAGAVVQAKDPAAARRLLDALQQAAPELIGGQVTEQTIQGTDRGLTARIPGFPLPVAAAIKGNRMAVGLGPEAVSGLLAPSKPISEDPLYGEAKKALGGQAPGMIVDPGTLGQLLGSLPGGDADLQQAQQVLSRLKLLAAGNSKGSKDGTFRQSFVLQYQEGAPPRAPPAPLPPAPRARGGAPGAAAARPPAGGDPDGRRRARRPEPDRPRPPGGRRPLSASSAAPRR